MNHKYRQRRCKLHTEIPVGNAVKRILHCPVKAEILCGHFTVGVVCRACKSARTERRIIHSRLCVGKPLLITQEHFRISHKMMSEGYRLRPLHMRISGHNRVAVLLRLFQKHIDKLGNKRVNAVALVAQIKPYVKSHLVVTASCGVKSLSRLTDTLRQFPLDKGVNILRIGVNKKLARLDFRFYPLQSRNDFFQILTGNNRLRRKHCCVCNASVNILFIHTAVKGNRRIEIVCLFINFL